MGKAGGKKTGEKKEKTDENSGHYVINSSWLPERRPLERRTLAPKYAELIQITTLKSVKIQKQSSTLNFTQFSQPHKKDEVSWI